MAASWNVMYSAKPKTPEVDVVPELLTAEDQAEQLEQLEMSPLSPEEQAFYDEQRKEQLRIQREAEAKRVRQTVKLDLYSKQQRHKTIIKTYRKCVIFSD